MPIQTHIYPDLLPAYVPCVVQCTKADGTKVDPTNLTDAISIYIEDGVNQSFATAVVKYTPAKIDGKTGFYGYLIPKSRFVTNKFTMVRWALTVDSIDTAKVDVVFCKNSSSINAGLSDAAVDKIWDELITPAHHNIKNSAGRSLFKIPAIIVHSGTAKGPGTGNNQIELDDDASAINLAYSPGLIYILEGTGAGQSRLIIDYVGSTKMCTIDRNWIVNPDDTSEFVIVADAGREHICEGLVSGATVNTITFCSRASSINDFYKNNMVFIRSGTGHGQVRMIDSYVGSTKVATLRRNWLTTPDETSGYIILPGDIISEIITEINANETKIDTAITGIVSVNEKADLIKDETDKIQTVDDNIDILKLRKDHNVVGD